MFRLGFAFICWQNGMQICPNALVGKLHFWSLISMTKIVFVPHFFLLNKKHFEIINWRHTAFEFTVKNQRSTLTELVCVIKWEINIVLFVNIRDKKLHFFQFFLLNLTIKWRRWLNVSKSVKFRVFLSNQKHEGSKLF